jgi:hypothetical protein
MGPIIHRLSPLPRDSHPSATRSVAAAAAIGSGLKCVWSCCHMLLISLKDFQAPSQIWKIALGKRKALLYRLLNKRVLLLPTLMNAPALSRLLLTKRQFFLQHLLLDAECESRTLSPGLRSMAALESSFRSSILPSSAGQYELRSRLVIMFAACMSFSKRFLRDIFIGDTEDCLLNELKLEIL